MLLKTCATNLVIEDREGKREVIYKIDSVI